MTNNKFAAALKNKAARPDPPKPLRAPAVHSPKRKHIGGYFDPEIGRRLRILSSEEDTTIQKLLDEALRLLFESRGKSLR